MERKVICRLALLIRRSREIFMKTRGLVKHTLVLCLLAAVLAAAPSSPAEQTSSLAAPLVPMQVRSARKIFLSNAGVDSGSIVAFNLLGKEKTDIPYAAFVAAMKSWAQYDVVTTPSDSDVVFEFRVESILSSLNGPFASFSTFISVTILDTRTHFVLWTVKSPLAVNKKFDQNAAAAVATLLASIKVLVAAGTVADS